MASEIQQVNLEQDRHPHATESEDDSEKKDVVRTDISDIEADAYAGGNSSDDNKTLLRRADRTELTPAEAFKWDVHGDQSPCRRS